MKNKENTFTDIAGNIVKTNCISCALQIGEIKAQGGSIYRTKYFDAHQDYEIPIPGFLIISSKRHIQSIDEFTEEEQIDFIKAITKIRKGMRKILNIDVIYLIQLEDTKHHFHVWLFPRYDWMMEKFGNKIASVKPIMEYAREFLKTEGNIKEVKEKANILREYLKK